MMPSTIAETFTQHDGLFLSEASVVGVELKLGTRSSVDQVIKYATLLGLEERLAGRQKQLGLLFIVPHTALKKHWATISLTTNSFTADYLDTIDVSDLSNGTIAALNSHRPMIEDVLSRTRTEVISWSWLRDELAGIEDHLKAPLARDQTLDRLLKGFRVQIERHGKAGIISYPT